MAHWRALFTSRDYLTSADLYNERTDSFAEITVEIERVQRVTLKGEGGREDQRPGIYFKGSKTGKPLGANATNCDAIERVVGTDDFKRWPGAWLTLFVTSTQVKEKGRKVNRPCIRVKPEKPTAEQIATAQKQRAASEEQQR